MSHELTPSQRALALTLAERSIAYGVKHHRAPELDALGEDVPESPHRATFVTIHLHGALKGCIGKLEAIQPLYSDIVENAYKAAFEDPRFPPLTADQLSGITIHISILSPVEPVPIDDESSLWEHVEPHRHGLLIEAGHHRATFLPSVWAQCPKPEEFLAHLKHKAGLPPHRPTPMMRFYRYTVEDIER